MVLQEMHILRRVLFEVIQMHLLAIDSSLLIPDVVRASDSLFLAMKRRSARSLMTPHPTQRNADEAA